MDIKSIFRSRSDTVESLVKKHKDLKQQKSDLKKKLDELKRQALTQDDVSNLSGRLSDIRSQLELSKTAISETEKALEKMLENKIASDWSGLDAERQKYESQLSDRTKQAATHLGQAVQDLEILNLSFAHVLSRHIREKIVEISTDYRFEDQLPSFLPAYQEQINAQNADPKFRDWRKQIQAIERLQPESHESKLHIKGQIKKMISA